MANLKISKNYSLFLDSFHEKNKIENPKLVDFYIFQELFKIREAQWNHKIKFNRKKDSSTSDIFQDLLVFYLKNIMDDSYEFILEYKKDKCQVDVLIKKNNENYAVIEVKTNIGWERDLVYNDRYKKEINKRAEIFGIPKNKVLYVFENSGNVNKKNRKRFEDANEEINNFVIPLFEEAADPFYFWNSFLETIKSEYPNKEIIEILEKHHKKYFKINNFQEFIKELKENNLHFDKNKYCLFFSKNIIRQFYDKFVHEGNFERILNRLK